MTGPWLHERSTGTPGSPAISHRSAVWAFGLLLASAIIQLIASLQRWVFFREDWTRVDLSIEDHLFDYWYPVSPWENLGVTAQLLGVGYLLLAAAVPMIARVGTPPAGRWTRILVASIAIPFAITGAHALISGFIGVSTVLQSPLLQTLVGLVPFVGLIILGIRAIVLLQLSAVACLFLLGATLPGYLLSTFTIAPMIAGHASHDTTPWTETIVAASVGLAAMVMLVAAIADTARSSDAARTP